MRLLVTGGAGFIGSALVRHLISTTEHEVLNYDLLTYAGHPVSLGAALEHPRHRLVRGDIADASSVQSALADFRPDAIVHLAAESHVDRSIDGPAAFIHTNIVGTAVLLQAALEYWRRLAPADAMRFRFLHVSTDEVFGSLSPEAPAFSETHPYRPNSPYAASKAASDHLVRAWHHTYGLPALITNCSNNYGPCQLPEKLIPLMVLSALEQRHLPIYGDGLQIRDWLYVDDHARALQLILERGMVGQTYNIGGGEERSNLEVVNAICGLLDECRPLSAPHRRLIRHVRDRPGHDRRYAIDDRRLRRELGWAPAFSFEDGLRRTVQWYLDHPDWIDQIRSAEHRRWIAQQYEGV